ncbi:hypothetical protein B0H34DRAFT_711041 [Crassisporium funariophilum]|nr:hypothetical protein B0H34DRAFT_711041 [Crassisporium funariophilum]
MQNVNNHPQHGNSLFYSNELQRSAIAQARHAHTSGPVGFATHTPQWTNQSSVSTMVNQVPGQFVNMQHGDCKPMSPEMKAQFQAFMAHSMQELHSELAGNSNQLEVVAGGEHDEQIGYEEVDIEDVAVERIQSPLTSSMGGMSLNESTQASTSRASDSNATHSGPSASVQDQPQNQPGIMNFRETFLESMQKTGLVAMDPSLFQAMPRASNIPPQSNSTVTHEFIHGDHVIVDNSAHVVNLGHSGVVANNRVIDSYRAAEPSKDDQIREGDNDKQERPSRRKQGFQKFFKRDHTSP